MKLTRALRGLIIENSKSEVLYNKYVKPNPKKKTKGMPFQYFKMIVLADPTTRIPTNFDIGEFTTDNLSGLKVGRYSDWMLKIFNNPDLSDEEVNLQEYQRLFLEDLTRFKEILTKYEKYKGSLADTSKKDINKVSSFEELSALPIKVGDDTVELELYRGKKPKKEKGVDAQKNFQFPGSEILFVGPNYTLVKISDTGELGGKAGAFFGGYHNVDKGESSWCTSTEGSSYSNSYRKDGPLYVILANDNKGEVGEVTGLPQERYQFHFPSNQFKNRQNRDIGVVDSLNGKLSELKEFFRPEFAKGLTSSTGEKVEVNYPDSSAGKFIALYGFDELFNSLPDNIERLFVSNKSSEKIALIVPPTISRFKNLSVLLFQNIVKELPENLGDLSKLTIISLPENKDLVSLPESIVNLQDLSFIQLRGANPNLKIPEKLLDSLDDVGNGFYYKV